MLLNGIVNVLELEPGKDWTSVRRELTDEKIGKIYHLYEGLWPRETDLLQLLPKPDGRARAVYTGTIHPVALTKLALGSSLYFGDLIIQHPFLNASAVKADFSPVKNPKSYRQEFIKSVHLFLNVMPLVDRGLISLVPDPCDFDIHLRDQMMKMAKSRSRQSKAEANSGSEIEVLMRQDFARSLMELPPDVLKSHLARDHPELDSVELVELFQTVEKLKERDPLCVLHAFLGDGEGGGQLSMLKLSPNFEMVMYLAQATGACIITDSSIRWREIRDAVFRRSFEQEGNLSALSRSIASATFFIPQGVDVIEALTRENILSSYPSIMRDAQKYLAGLVNSRPKPNVEANLNARFVRMHSLAQAAVKKARVPGVEARVTSIFPSDGIQDNAVNRLLLMSSAERHFSNVPMAFFLEKI